MKRLNLVTATLLLAAACTTGEFPATLPDAEPGISLALATERARTIKNVRYQLSFSIPAVESAAVSGHAVIRFGLAEVTRPLVLDFTPGPESIASITVNHRPSAFRLVKDHIVIPRNEITVGDNAVEIVFRAGDARFHRTGHCQRGVDAEDHAAALRLVRLGPFIDELTTELWILTHPELRDVARVATVYAFLREEIRKLRPVFLGKEGESRPARHPRSQR